MAPIRVALIGLSSSAATAWASKAHLPYLLSTRGREKFEITALLNSSVEAARAAIKHYGLPDTTSAYGNPDDLAADPNVDLVVDTTRVDVHYPTVRPSLVAGKAAFVEWPLADNLEHAKELTELARSKGLRTAVGLQGRLAPVFLKIKEIVESGRIGAVLSSEARAAGGSIRRDILPPKLRYFTQRSVGGNIYTIGFGHLFDSIQFVLGPIQNPHAHLQIQYPKVTILDPTTGASEIVQADVPDLIIVSGNLPVSPAVKADSSLLVRFRRGQPFKGEPAFVWTITGEKGELRLTSPDGPSLQAGPQTSPVTIEVHDFASDAVERVEWKWADWQLELPPPARNIGAVYEAYAEGAEETYATFEDALKHHELLEGLLQKFA